MHYRVAGHLNVPRPPQGHPVLVQAGSSDAGVSLAARFAELVFTPQSVPEEGAAFRQRIRAEAGRTGRSANSVRTLPGLSFLLASTSFTFAAAVMRKAREGGWSFRQAAQHFAELPGGLHHTGTPEGLADLIERWIVSGSADGFTLQPLRCPLDLAIFSDEVVPILQRRGLVQREYGPGTLRDRLGLARPANVHLG